MGNAHNVMDLIRADHMQLIVEFKINLIYREKQIGCCYSFEVVQAQSPSRKHVVASSHGHVVIDFEALQRNEDACILVSDIINL